MADRKIRYCDICGTEIKSFESKFCKKCGADLSELYRALDKEVDVKQNIPSQTEKVKEKIEDKYENQVADVASDNSIPEETKINRIIHATGIACGVIALQPIPIADIFILTPIQTTMMMYIGKIKGFPVSVKRAKEILLEITGVIGGALIGQHAVILAYKTVLPFAGGFFTIPLVWGVTFGIGRAAVAYYDLKKKSNKPLTAQDKGLLKKTYEEGQKDGIKKGRNQGKAEVKKEYTYLENEHTMLIKQLDEEKNEKIKTEKRNKILESELNTAYQLLVEAGEETKKEEIVRILHKSPPKEKIEMLSRLIRNYTLAEIAIKDLEKIVHQEKEFYTVFNDLVTYDRNPFNSPPGMNKQKYYAGKDIVEVRISQKYRFFINDNKKIIIRITLEYNHPKMMNWFNSTTKY